VRHASFFSGVGGLDLGFERAGIQTVSVSEIDPYACAVLAERFPDAPNLGDLVKLAERELGGSNEQGYLADKNDWRLQRPLPASGAGWTANAGSESNVGQADGGRSDWRTADIWSGGFPCQDLSVAGKRAGFAGKRSSLAFTFLDLVEQRRPRWLVLENVPGLFSSNKGADFGRLLYEMEQLRYGVSWRTLDARYFGVAQRRRRVFLVASLESDRAGEVLLECEGCERHPSPRWTQRQGAASGVRDGSGIVGALPAGVHGFPDGVQEFLQGHFRVVGEDGRTIGATADANGVRAADGMARRLDNQQGVDTFGAETHRSLQARDWKAGVSNQDIGEDGYLVGYQTRADEKNGNFSIAEAEVANSLSALWPGDTSHRSMTLVAPAVFRKSARAQTNQDSETWVEGDVANTLNSFDVGDVRTTHAIVGGTQDEDDLLPVGLDSHRYRCCGNGVVAPVAEWIGRRIVEVDRRWREEGK